MISGDIAINHHVIGTWAAVRQTMDVNQVNRYNCTVVLDNEQYTFVVSHTYTEGGAVLAAKVLTRAAELAGKIEEET